MQKFFKWLCLSVFVYWCITHAFEVYMNNAEVYSLMSQSGGGDIFFTLWLCHCVVIHFV